jgi:repressor LexA
MSVGSRIKEAREHLGLTQEQLAKDIGVTKGAIGNYEADISHPKVDILYRLLTNLKCDANFLFQDEMTKNDSSFQCTLPEQTLIKKYRALDEHGKKSVELILNHEFVRTEIKQAEQQSLCVRETPLRQLPLYDLPASAGTGAFLDSNEYEMIDVGSDVPLAANFGVRIVGDSMEPKISDSDIVWVKQQPYLEEGHIGIFVLNGEGYCKKYFKDKLVSLNPVYEDILINEYDELRIVGEVL